VEAVTPEPLWIAFARSDADMNLLCRGDSGAVRGDLCAVGCAVAEIVDAGTKIGAGGGERVLVTCRSEIGGES
jgi:hypothetical protein